MKRSVVCLGMFGCTVQLVEATLELDRWCDHLDVAHQRGFRVIPR